MSYKTKNNFLCSVFLFQMTGKWNSSHQCPISGELYCYLLENVERNLLIVLVPLLLWPVFIDYHVLLLSSEIQLGQVFSHKTVYLSSGAALL